MTSKCILDQALYEFVKDSVKSFDESHDLNHAITVTNSAHRIMRTLQETYDLQLLSYMAMLHDVCDHKYPESITKEMLYEFVVNHLGEEKMENVKFVIENLSWSKEVKGLRKQIPSELSNYMIAVSDADRLEAIGRIGLKRCYAFTKAKNSDMDHDEIVRNVVAHCNEKLLRLYNDGFIVSEIAREIAKPLHKEIEMFMKKPSEYEF